MKKKVSCRDHVLSSSLWSEGFDVDEEIINTMNGTPQNEFDGYKCIIFLIMLTMMALWEEFF